MTTKTAGEMTPEDTPPEAPQEAQEAPKAAPMPQQRLGSGVGRWGAFVASYIRRHPEYADLVPPGDRARLLTR